MGKIILFYKYVTIEQPEQIKAWFTKLCTDLGLTGRIILAHEGINSTVGGSDESIATFINTLNNHPLFQNIDFKDAPGDQTYFPRMRISIKNEIVHLGIDPTQLTANQGGKHLTPQEAHELLNSKPDNLVLIDTRNQYESRIGTIPGSLCPDKRYFRQFPEYIDEHLDELKGKQVLMYCSGGIRCERASAYVKEKNVAQEVYQITGGIHRYIEQFPDGHFKGSYYVFDGRISIRASNDILTNCDLCQTPCDFYVNCMNGLCNKQFIACPTCVTAYAECCSTHCKELTESRAVPIRKKPVIAVEQRLQVEQTL